MRPDQWFLVGIVFCVVFAVLLTIAESVTKARDDRKTDMILDALTRERLPPRDSSGRFMKRDNG